MKGYIEDFADGSSRVHFGRQIHKRFNPSTAYQDLPNKKRDLRYVGPSFLWSKCLPDVYHCLFMRVHAISLPLTLWL